MTRRSIFSVSVVCLSLVTPAKSTAITHDDLNISSDAIREFGLTDVDLDELLDSLDNDDPLFDEDGTLLGRRAFFNDVSDETTGDLGDLPGGASQATAHAANDAGAVVGESVVETGTHAFLWTAEGGIEDIGDLPGGDADAVARDINATNRVVGQGTTDDGMRAFLWTREQGIVDMNTLLDPSSRMILLDARVIDDDNRIGGHALNGNDMPIAFLWDPDTGIIDLTPPEKPRTLDNGGSNARLAPVTFVELRDLGPVGVAVGKGMTADDQARAVLWRDGQELTDLGDGSQVAVAHAVSGATRIVGHAETEMGDRAFVWSELTGMTDLNTLFETEGDITLQRAVDIDETGRILAYGTNGDEIHYFLLTPQENSGPSAGGGNAAIIPVAKGREEIRYDIVDYGEFLLDLENPAILSFNGLGLIVGGCDLLTEACPYLRDNLEGVTNRFEELANLIDDGLTNFFGQTSPSGGSPTSVSITTPGRSAGPVGGTTLSPDFGSSTPTFLGSSVTDGGDFPDDRSLTDGNGATDGGGSPDGGGFTDDGDGGADEILPAVPLPPAGFGLLLAMGLLGIVRRRRRAT